MSNVCNIAEPTNYKEASEQSEWVEAMNKEIHALIKNNTWDIVDLPPGKKAIGCKWVYKVKLKPDGTLERCKARLVAQGYTQKFGVDYEETFSPVIKMTTIRALIAIAASKGWDIFQLDVNNAFLHGDLHEEVYMRMPKGIENPGNKFCKLNKSLYGLKQASRQWFFKLHTVLLHQGFVQSKQDYSLFIKKRGSDITIVAVYVDDILVTGTNPNDIQTLKAHLDTIFSIKDLGILHYFLGIEVSYSQAGIILTQKKFTKSLLDNCGFDLSKSAPAPLSLNTKLLDNSGALYAHPDHYRSLIGKLNFLTHTRPDLSFSVQTLSQFMHTPRQPHVDALHHVLRYVHGTTRQGILLHGSEQLTLQAFSDSDWAACPNSRRSVTGYVMLLGRSPMSWKSKKQATVSRSSSEAEYRAMASAASEITWLIQLLQDLGVYNLEPVLLHCDNMSAIHIAKNPVFHERTKHIEVDCHFTRDKVLEGLLQLTYLPTQNQLADVFTKALPSPQFCKLLTKLGVVNTTPA